MKHLLCCFLLLLLSGCATAQGIDEHVDMGLGRKTTIYRDQWVHRNPPEVHVEARDSGAGQSNLNVLFIPFRVTQEMPNPSIVGYTISRIFWQTWTTMQLFPSIEFTGDDTPYRRDRAIQLARLRGAELVVGGFVTYIYPGGTASDTQLAVQVEVHDARSGQLIWSMAQSGIIPVSRLNDYVLFAVKTRLPSDPMHAIAKALASDMGIVIQNWIASPAPGTRAQQMDKNVRDTLFSPRDTIPTPRNTQDEHGKREEERRIANDKAF